MSTNKLDLQMVQDQLASLHAKELELVRQATKENPKSTQIAQNRKWQKALRVIEALMANKEFSRDDFEAVVNPPEGGVPIVLKKGDSVLDLLDAHPNMGYGKLVEKAAKAGLKIVGGVLA